jgi:hypothetical protein
MILKFNLEGNVFILKQLLRMGLGIDIIFLYESVRKIRCISRKEISKIIGAKL